MLSLLGEDCSFTVFTQDPQSWQTLNPDTHPLWLPAWIMNKDMGLLYFLKFLLIATQVLVRWPMLKKPGLMIGASGPGIDLAAYLVRYITGTPILQMIHGPVATSKTIGKCLMQAEAVHYLPGCKSSIRLALDRAGALHEAMVEPRYVTMLNGLAIDNWPTQATQETESTPSVFWAASLLKWKGLDLLTAALNKVPEIKANICYIQPKNIALEHSEIGQSDDRIHWYKEPKNLDEIRAGSQIFVSTSQHEPFGLSILEAIAAGQCIVLPADGSYWDKVLVDGANCVKYTPGDSQDLANKLRMLCDTPELVIELGHCAGFISRNYHAEAVYQPQLQAISYILLTSASNASTATRGVWQ
ncbi:glycosyltransferase family 4 protein [Shewanella corallii]|uniref:Glycosyltransferase family 4 protein n=1 Tax=Shewanella corallii TaxID=560080 RepID=A0ABT0N6F2_9GAMM|nr:glycosyltransferase family 4 protein [Shewanella corallii]MCL2914037.1 glycosyltransferase family 4 protein [Shewanella corallii]